ncbi:MAG: hypothetical protein IPQ07_00165 [Myxococcales bacterium]|nr:hypothetical protein [Myxococcales bacterium]
MIRPALAADLAAVATLCRGLGIAAPPLRGTLIAERDGTVAGYVRIQPLGAIGYVRDLVTAPRADDTNLPLMLAAAAALRSAGVREWHLDAPPESAAIGVYEQLGMQPAHRSTALRFPWARLPELPGDHATPLSVSVEDDDDLERSLGMLGGQLAMVRRRPHLVLRQLRDETCAAVGFAALDPAGARLFRVARPRFAAPLLAALRPFAHHPDLALVLDDQDALVALLTAHGAKVMLRLLHYSGPLP